MTHQHATPSAYIPGLHPGTLSATLRALAGMTPGDVDTAIQEPAGTTKDVERGRLCSCRSRKVLRYLLGRAGRRAVRL